MKRLNITSTILDKLGFSEYWDEHGNWGGRTLTFSDGTKFRIIERKEEDPDYCNNGNEYAARHWYFTGWFALPKNEQSHFDLFFIHEMYQCLWECYPNVLNEFSEKCKELGMESYIQDYINSEAEKGEK